jgi:hypothetical protein
MNEINVPHGTRQKLQKIFSKSHVYVRKALRGECKTDDKLALKIRKAALENGGKELQIVEPENKKAL